MTLPWQNVCVILFSLRIFQNLILKNAALNKDSITTGILVHPTDTFVNASVKLYMYNCFPTKVLDSNQCLCCISQEFD